MSSPAAEERIRPMSASDLERVLEIAAGLPEAPQWAALAYVAAMDAGNTPRRIALVAADPESDRPIGLLVAGVIPPTAELETIAVPAGGQRRGVGGRLMHVLLEELRRAQVGELMLEVRASNQAAQRFYRAQGFAETGRRPRYYADPEEDAVLMGLRVS